MAFAAALPVDTQPVKAIGPAGEVEFAPAQQQWELYNIVQQNIQVGQAAEPQHLAPPARACPPAAAFGPPSGEGHPTCRAGQRYWGCGGCRGWRATQCQQA